MCGSSANVALADLRFADPIFFVICGLLQVRKYKLFLIENITKNRFKKTTFWTVLRQSCKNLRIRHLRIGTPKKFSDLRLRNEHKNLCICALNKKSLIAHLSSEKTMFFVKGLLKCRKIF
jgi:hypothetical protein